MARWSVILFPYDAPGRRMKKGDIIDIRLPGHPWSERTKNSHIIVYLDGIDDQQRHALMEWIYDLDSYNTYSPMSREEYLLYMDSRNLPKWDRLTISQKDEYYIRYLIHERENCELPSEMLVKRRFSINGVKSWEAIQSTTIYDKMRNRNVLLTDKLRIIQPRTLEEMTLGN